MAWRQSRTGFSSVDSIGRTSKDRGEALGFGDRIQSSSRASGFSLDSRSRNGGPSRSSSTGFGLGSTDSLSRGGSLGQFRPSSGFGSLAGEEPIDGRRKPSASSSRRLANDDFGLGSVGALGVLGRGPSSKATVQAVADNKACKASATVDTEVATLSGSIERVSSESAKPPAVESLEEREARLHEAQSGEALGRRFVPSSGVSDEQLARLVEEGRNKKATMAISVAAPEPSSAVPGRHSLDDAEGEFEIEEEAPEEHEDFEAEPSELLFAESCSGVQEDKPPPLAKSCVESVATPQARSTRASLAAMGSAETPSPIAPPLATTAELRHKHLDVPEGVGSSKRRKSDVRTSKVPRLDAVSSNAISEHRQTPQPSTCPVPASLNQQITPLPCWDDIWGALEEEGWRVEMSGSKRFFMQPGVQRGKKSKLHVDYFDDKKRVIEHFLAIATAAHEAAGEAPLGIEQRVTANEPKTECEGEEDEEKEQSVKDDHDEDGEKIEEIDEWQEFTPENIDLSRCMARTWAGGRGGQCPRPVVSAGTCGLHREGKMPCGRVDGTIPAAKLREFRVVKARKSACKDGATLTNVRACRKKRLQTSDGDALAKRARSPAMSDAEATPEMALVEKKPALPKTKTINKKPQALKGNVEPPSGLASLVPFGANFVANDKKKGKYKGSAKGGTKISNYVNRFIGKNGKTKARYLPRSEGREYDGSQGFVSKEERKRNRATSSLADRTFVASGATAKQAFSRSVTAELLSAVPSTGLGEIAEIRPPDAVVVEQMPDKENIPLAVQELMAAATTSCYSAKAAPAAQPAPSPSAESTSVATVDQQLPVPLPVASKLPQDYSDDDLDQVLRQSFGHNHFRPGQREALTSLLAGQKTLLLLSTGSGKSLCYQLPAFLLREEGLTLVISPLLSLMADQLQRLPSCLRGAIVSSQQNSEEVKTVMRAVRARLVDVLFISPERLSMWSFDGCGLPPIALACIDEGHCVSEWSHNFRPDYMRLHEFLSGTLNARRVLALTATATRPTIQSICEILRMERVVRSDRSFSLEEIMQEPKQPRVQRTNLTMDVRCYEDEEQQGRELVKILTSEENRRVPAIVYAWKRVTCDQLAKRLRSHIPGGVRSYHGSLDPEIRRAVQGSFMSGETRVIIATMAFGMGLDKPDIRCVVHYNMPKSIENYIQETGRCSRDGLPGRCVGMVNPSDYKVMRWMESGGGGGGMQSGSVRKLLGKLLSDQAGHTQDKFEVKDAALDAVLGSQEGRAEKPWRPYNVAFDEARMSHELGIPKDEMHSVLVHFAYHARSSVTLYSRFPTKLKLRFFRTSPEQLMNEDALLRKVLPMAKKVAGVYTLDTAKVMAEMGGEPGRISNALWQAQGDEFKVQKDEYGYMLHVHEQPTEAQIEAWAAKVCGINVAARKNGIEKLDACYIALRRGAELSAKAKSLLESGSEGGEAAGVQAADDTLNGIINSYFAATEDPAAVVAGSENERMLYLRKALGSEYNPDLSHRPAPRAFGAAPPPGSGGAVMPRPSSADADAVYPVVARLLMSSDWPKVPSDDQSAETRAVAQFLAGIGTLMMPATKWRTHSLWGRFRGFAEFSHLEDLVVVAMKRLRTLQATAAKR